MMKSRLALLYAFFLSFLLWSGAAAQNDVQFSAQIRQRFESDNRDFSSETGANNFNLLRSRIGVRLASPEKVSAFVQLQDARRFGEETNTLKDGSADNLDVHQAYFQIDALFASPLSLKVGRMEMILGSERLVGAVGWDNIGRSFDGALAHVQKERFSLDFFALKEVEKSRVENDGDRNIYGAYADWKIAQKCAVQPFLIWQREKPSANLDRKTAGVNFSGKYGNLTQAAEFAYQWGTAGGKDVSALFAALNLTYSMAAIAGKPAIGLALDYLSGDENPNDQKINVFNTLYATNHKFYGFMDYFLNIPVHTFGLGLADWQVHAALTPGRKVKAKLVTHFFRANEDFALSTGKTARSFGTELDLTLNYKYNQSATLVFGASLFAPGDIFKEARGEDTATWLYLMTIVNL